MIRVLIVSPEPRLVNAIKNVVGDVSYQVEESWSAGQTELLREDLDLAFLDFEALRGVAVDSMVSLETVFKDVTAVLLVRQEDAKSREMQGALPSLSVIDMSQGKPYFQAKVQEYVQGVRGRQTVSSEDRAEAAKREARRERDRLAEPERKKTKAYRATEDSAALEHELQGMWMHMRSVDRYELFGAWKGCGRKVIQDRFYLMVKEHHPDVYGGNVSENVKELAQNIFIYVKDTYQQLIQIEKDQKVAASSEPSANPFLRRATTATNTQAIGHTQTPGRQPHSTPIAQDAGRTRSRSVVGVEPEKPKEEELSREEVQARMQRLSAFRQRQQHRAHREALSADSEAELSEPSSIDSLEMEISEPEVDPEAERQARLLELKRKASKVNHPNVQNPAKEAFNEGYRAYRSEHFADAFKHFAMAYQINPDDGMHQTFYGYLLFRQFPEKHAEAEEILKVAMNSGHKQAMPDALLFMGHLLKARGETDKALKHYERCLKLNPGCVEAERELRLSKIRNERKSSEPGSFMKNLFKK